MSISRAERELGFKVIGNDTTVTMAAEAGQLQLNVMEPVIGQAMFESVHILTNACYNLLEKCINGRIAFVFSTAPHGTAAGREGLDALLATSALTDDLAVFFIADGVFQLLSGQKPDAVSDDIFP